MKIKEFAKELEGKNIDAAILINKEDSHDVNVSYFSEINANGSCLLVKEDATLFVSPLEYERAAKTCLIKVKNSGNNRLTSLLKRHLGKSRRIGINFSAISLKRFNELRREFSGKMFYDISEICRGIRIIKNDEELRIIKHACKITDKIFESYINNVKKLRTEGDIARFFNNKFAEFGAESAFNPIIASSKNASMPHYELCSSRIKKGFCILDFGAKYRNYCSDMTRTVYYGIPSAREKELYEKILSVQDIAIKTMQPGIKGKSAYNSARKMLGKLSGLFIHGLGHGIGMEVHESPSLNRNSEDILKENMVFTIEPGIYKKNKFGIRIEDTVFLNRNCRPLTNSDKELITLKL